MIERTVLLVGCGKMGHHYLRAFENMGQLSSVIGVGPTSNPDSAALLESAGRPLYPDLESALSSGSYHSAIVAAPVGVHFELTEKLLRAGIPVLLEKPLSGKLSLWLSLLELSQQQKLLLFPAFTEASHLAWKPLIERLPSLGILQKVETVRVGPRSWRPPEIASLSDLAIHDLEHLTSLFPGVQWECSGLPDEELSRLTLRPTDSPLFASSAELSLLAGWGDFEDGARSILIQGDRGELSIDWATGLLNHQTAEGTQGLLFPQTPLEQQLSRFFALQSAGENREIRERQRSATEAMELLDHFQRIS